MSGNREEVMPREKWERRQLTFEFKQAVRRAHFHGERRSYEELALASGFYEEVSLRKLLNAREVSYSPMMISRVDRLARLVGVSTDMVWKPR